MVSDIQKDSQSIVSLVAKIKSLPEDSAEFAVLKAEITRKELEMQRKYDDIKRQANKESSKALEQLARERQDFHSQLMKQFNIIENQRIELQQREIEATSLDIALGHASRALERFRQLGLNTSLLPGIIKQAYTQSRHKPFENTRQFIELLSPQVQAVAYVALYQSIKASKLSTDPQLIMFDASTESLLSRLGDDEHRSEAIVSAVTGAKEAVAQLFAFWAGAIKRQEYQQINAFLGSSDEARESTFLRRKDGLVKLVIGAGNLEPILAFAKQLPWESGRALVFRDVVSVLKNTTEAGFTLKMMKVAYTMRECENNGVPHAANSSVVMSYVIDYEIPQKIRQLYWNDGTDCYIRYTLDFLPFPSISTEVFNRTEYLYAEGDDFKDGRYRQVFAWTSGDRIPGSKWKIALSDTAPLSPQRFHIISQQYDGYYLLLKNTGGTYSDKARNVYAAYPTKEETAEWLFYPVTVDGKHFFIIKSLEHWEDLYVSFSEKKYDKDRRRVFTGKDRRLATPWDIVCE